MRAAWEWRGFDAAAKQPPLMELAELVAGRLALPAPPAPAAEADTYLIMPGLRHNLKLRRGSLELKRLVSRLRGGFSLWEDKVVWPFPLDQPQISELWSLLPGRRYPPPGRLDSARQLISVLQHQLRGLSVVQLFKQRVRFDNGEARLEVADLELPGAFRWISYCVDGYDLPAVRTMVQHGCAGTGLRVMSYVDFLQEAVWWFPIPTREVVGIDGV